MRTTKLITALVLLGAIHASPAFSGVAMAIITMDTITTAITITVGITTMEEDGAGLVWGRMGLIGYGIGSMGRAPYYAPSYGYPPVGYGANYYGYPPNYGYPPVVAAPSAPPIYIQQEVVQVQPQAQGDNYWHYCRKPDGYYPYVKNCPGGWIQVAPEPRQ